MLKRGLFFVLLFALIIFFNGLPLVAEILFQRANLAYKGRDPVAALEKMETVLALAPRVAEYHLFYGQLLSERGDTVLGDQALAQAVSLEPDNFVRWEKWAKILVYQGRYTEALEKYQRVLALFPHHSIGYSERAMAFAQMGDLGQAEHDLLRAVDLDATDAIAYVRLGDLYRKQKRVTDAICAFREAIKWDSRFLYPYVQLFELGFEEKMLKTFLDNFSLQLHN